MKEITKVEGRFATGNLGGENRECLGRGRSGNSVNGEEEKGKAMGWETEMAETLVEARSEIGEGERGGRGGSSGRMMERFMEGSSGRKRENCWLSGRCCRRGRLWRVREWQRMAGEGGGAWRL